LYVPPVPTPEIAKLHGGRLFVNDSDGWDADDSDDSDADDTATPVTPVRGLQAPTPSRLCLSDKTGRLYVSCAEPDHGVLVFDLDNQDKPARFLFKAFGRTTDRLRAAGTERGMGSLLLVPHHKRPLCLDATDTFLLVGLRDQIVAYRLSNGMRSGLLVTARCRDGHPSVLCNMCTTPDNSLAVLSVRDVFAPNFASNARPGASRSSEINLFSLLQCE
jgi:hypothetical protein